jgi:hypothetical protein
MNLTGVRYYDTQYVYTSSFAPAATLAGPRQHVLVTPPTSVFLTLQVHLQQKKKKED